METRKFETCGRVVVDGLLLYIVNCKVHKSRHYKKRLVYQMFINVDLCKFCTSNKNMVSHHSTHSLIISISSGSIVDDLIVACFSTEFLQIWGFNVCCRYFKDKSTIKTLTLSLC